ncbi:MAG: PAS domain-containing protein [Nisaea sp.]|jgi:hypothetical protein|uniref:PAS domain-containing protein n=1 Tax=Nisaea sp. TaxID=2024842 RepID=UPI001B1FF851|nr:PAS domain-containing protein [Nisaea sp.]MBO6562919.1 PAS domain-containing protein [Nisaea sp.]
MIASEKRLEDVRSPLVREAYMLWDDKRGARPMPARADFDPVEMPRLLASMILVDVEQPETRLKVRLAGTKIVDMFGSDYTGMYMDEIDFGDVREKVLGEYLLCATEKRPLFSDHSFRKINDYYHSIERVLLPLSNDGKTVNMLMAVLDFERMREPVPHDG